MQRDEGLVDASLLEFLLDFVLGTIDGQRGDHILLAPPFIISDDQIGELVDKLDTAIGKVLSM